MSLENRTDPKIGQFLTDVQLDNLLLEAKVKGNIIVKIN